jgi:hypothetical protein
MECRDGQALPASFSWGAPQFAPRCLERSAVHKPVFAVPSHLIPSFATRTSEPSNEASVIVIVRSQRLPRLLIAVRVGPPCPAPRFAPQCGHRSRRPPACETALGDNANSFAESLITRGSRQPAVSFIQQVGDDRKDTAVIVGCGAEV